MLHLNIPPVVPHQKRMLIDEQSSPLHRIMWIYNIDEPEKRAFENNICAFHIGNGYILSVAHNLRIQAGYIKSIQENLFQKEILYKMDGSQKLFWDEHYFTDGYTRKMYINTMEPSSLQNIAGILKQKRFDTRWETLAKKNICNPYLVVQFRNEAFYNSKELAATFAPHQVVYEPDARKYTYLLQVELVEAFYSADIALYRIIKTPKEVIDAIPSVDVDLDFLEETQENLYCLQSSPNSPAGRLLNEAKIEGILDHFGVFQDEVGGNYLFEGYRYLVKGYFRFGSSGAPYLIYDAAKGKYVANAIQSEASGIQLSIHNEREGNFQYINAIASPLYIIKDQLEKYLNGDKEG